MKLPQLHTVKASVTSFHLFVLNQTKLRFDRTHCCA